MKDFHDNFEVVFIDSSGVLNLLANMTATAFHQVILKLKIFFEIGIFS